MNERNTFPILLLVALGFIVQCLAYQPEPSKAVSKDGLRKNFKDLIGANPNYFGNAPESNQSPVFPQSYDTQYEQLVAIGFNPILSVLEATIEIKLPYGFGGDLCSNGSLEYVRFYVSYGEGWNDLGAVTVNTHNFPDVLDCDDESVFPLFYALTLPFQPNKTQNCKVPVLPEVRAILSWSQLPPPFDPYFAPIYGNALDQHIQSPALTPPPSTTDPTSCAPSEPKALNKRSDFQKLLNHHPYPAGKQHVLPEQSSQTPSLSDISISRPGSPKNIWFEELIGLGIDYDLSRIVATVRIKQPYGYSNGPCDNGTFEYIAFWADWYNTCQWTYLGELTINVHSFPRIPFDGLTYSVALPVDLRNVSNFCNVTRISRVRAALSWNTPPPSPPKVAVRGNWLQTHLQIQPYTSAPNLTQPEIYTIGSVSPLQIDVEGNGETLPNATFVGIFDSTGAPLHTDPDWEQGERRQCPFGDSIYIRGPTIGQLGASPGKPSQYQYRIVYIMQGSTSDPLPVLNPIYVSQLNFPFTVLYHPLNSQGYFNYLPLDQNTESLLGRWTPQDRGLYQIRLEIAIQTSPPGQVPPTYKNAGATPWYNIKVNDHKNPDGPKGTLTFTNEPLCGFFPAGTILEGTFSAESPFFRSYSIWIADSNIPIQVDGGLLPPAGFTEISSPMDWSWNSTNAPPCGYVIFLLVCDLTIYDSRPQTEYLDCVGVPGTGFCVTPAG